MNQLVLKNALAIGVIGGADGPTAIFITSKTTPILIIAAVALVAIAVVTFIIIKSKKNKK